MQSDEQSRAKIKRYLIPYRSTLMNVRRCRYWTGESIQSVSLPFLRHERDKLDKLEIAASCCYMMTHASCWNKGLTGSNKKLVGAPGIATRSKGLTSSNKKLPGAP